MTLPTNLLLRTFESTHVIIALNPKSMNVRASSVVSLFHIGKIPFIPIFARFSSRYLLKSSKKMSPKALCLPHCTLEVNEPYKESYEKAIHTLRKRHGIFTLITGDIAEVDGQPNWIKECSKYSGVDVLTPLWEWDRLELLNRLLLYKVKIIFSCVKKPWFTDDWVGAELNRDSLERLCTINAATKIDICGEQGEYHTLVVDGPLFKKSIHIDIYSKHTEDSLMYIDIQKVVLREK